MRNEKFVNRLNRLIFLRLLYGTYVYSTWVSTAAALFSIDLHSYLKKKKKKNELYDKKKKKQIEKYRKDGTK